MNYIYTVIYKIEGISANSLNQDKVVYQDNVYGTTVILTSDINRHSEMIDKGSVCAGLILRGIFGDKNLQELPAEIESALAKIQEERASNNQNGTYAIIMFEGEEELSIETKLLRETDQLSICFDAIDKGLIRDKHKEKAHAVVASLAIASNPQYHAEKVAHGVHFIDANNKPLYSYTAQFGNARLTQSKPTNADLEEEIGHLIGLASSNLQLKTPFRLFTQSLETTQDNLRSFLSAWLSIEILTNKIFSIYEEEFINGIAGEHNSYGVDNFLDRITSVMKDKYRLTDKFSLIASFLSSEIEEDIELFKRMKKIRDTISHGNEFNEETLPVENARELAGKYLKYHMLTH